MDPSFEENIPKINHDSESIQQRLLLLKQIRELARVSNQKEDSIDEATPEYMEKIINDLTNEDLDILSEFDQGDNELRDNKNRRKRVEVEKR